MAPKAFNIQGKPTRPRSIGALLAILALRFGVEAFSAFEYASLAILCLGWDVSGKMVALEYGVAVLAGLVSAFGHWTAQRQNVPVAVTMAADSFVYTVSRIGPCPSSLTETEVAAHALVIFFTGKRTSSMSPACN
jgi:hypothetical protein